MTQNLLLPPTDDEEGASQLARFSFSDRQSARVVYFHGRAD